MPEPSFPAKSALFVGTNIDDPAKEDAFNKWYNDVHLPDVLSTGVFHSATRWVNVDPQPGEPKFLALYFTEWDDPVAAHETMSARLEEMRKKGTGGSRFEGMSRVYAHRYQFIAERRAD